MKRTAILLGLILTTSLYTRGEDVSSPILYDIVLENGRVVFTTADPSGPVLDQVLNIGILEGKIAAVTEAPLLGNDTIDCTGLVVSPGFVDIHYHGEALNAAQIYRVRDGITTSADTEWGTINLDGHLQDLERKGLISNHFTSSAVMAGHNYAFSSRKTYKIVKEEGLVTEYVKQSLGRYMIFSFLPARFWNQPLENSAETTTALALAALYKSPTVYPFILTQLLQISLYALEPLKRNALEKGHDFNDIKNRSPIAYGAFTTAIVTTTAAVALKTLNQLYTSAG